VVSDAAGAFELRQLLAGTHHLEVSSPEFRAERVSVDLATADTAEGIELELTNATTIRGEIRAGDDACAAGSLELSGALRLSSAADGAGKVEIRGVLPGSYELTVTCPWALPLRERLVVGSSPIRRTWELEQGIVIRGSVETSAGRPLANAAITWTRIGEPMQTGSASDLPASERSCLSDPHGEFTCGGLEPGHYVAALRVYGQLQSAAPELDLRGSSQPDRVRLRADPSGTIRVNVDGADDARGVPISVFACNQQGEPVLARRHGEGFLLERLPFGTYGVDFGLPECTRDLDAAVTLGSDGEVVDVSLPLPRLARIRGRLVDADGAPVPDVWVRASAPQRAWALLVEVPPAVITDSEGEFSLPGLLPSRYDVLAHSTLARAAARQRVDLAAGDELELRLVLRHLSPSGDLSTPFGQLTTDHEK
jgi:hypothetical protein